MSASKCRFIKDSPGTFLAASVLSLTSLVSWSRPQRLNFCRSNYISIQRDDIREHTVTYFIVVYFSLLKFFSFYFNHLWSFMHDSTEDKWLVKAPFYGWTMMIWNAEVHSEVLVRHIPFTFGDTAGEKRSFGSFGSFLRRRFPVEPSVIFANFSSVLVPLTPRNWWYAVQWTWL